MKIKNLMFALAATLLAACSNDDDKPLYGLNVNIDYGTIATKNVSELEITIKGNGITKTSRVTDFANYYGKYFELENGSYVITATGKVKDNRRATIMGQTEVTVKGSTSTILNLDLNYDYTLKTVTFDETQWNSLIDNPEYMGSQLYAEGYNWADASTTLSHKAHVTDWGYGMIFPDYFEAISNYTSTDIATKGSFTNQLTVYGTGAHSGNNFCIHYGYESYPGAELSSIKFNDGIAREIESMYVNNTTYFLNAVQNGVGIDKAAGDKDTVYVNAIGYNADKKVSELKFYLFIGGKAITSWTKVDLTPLGKVTEVRFDMGGTIKNSYGFSAPAYFAYDDIAIRFDK